MSTSPELGNLRAFQGEFAARIRDPRGQPRPGGVPARRMRVYEELLFANLEGLLLPCFPITRKLLGDRAWSRTTRHFFAEHRCCSPLFRDIPGEFLAWMEKQAETLFPDHPWLYEFMHYEWVELAVSISPEELDSVLTNTDGDLLDGRPILNPTSQLLSYHYPVHRIGPRFNIPEVDGSLFYYLVYRDRKEKVRFIVLNPLSARLLEILRDGAASGEAALQQIAGELKHDNPDILIETGRTLLNELRAAEAVLGTSRRVSRSAGLSLHRLSRDPGSKARGADCPGS